MVDGRSFGERLRCAAVLINLGGVAVGACDVGLGDLLELGTVQLGREFVENGIAAQIDVGDVEYGAGRGARRPGLVERHRQQTECAAGALEVWDGGQPLVEHSDEFGMERVRTRQQFFVLSALVGLAWHRVPLRSQTFVQRSVLGSDSRDDRVVADGLEETSSEDGSDLGVVGRDDNRRLTGRHGTDLSERVAQELLRRLSLLRVRVGVACQ